MVLMIMFALAKEVEGSPMQYPPGNNYGSPQGYQPAPPPVKDPSTGLLLELLGFFGLSGIGWLWAGETAIGLILLFGYWIFIAVEVVLMFVFVGFCLTPFNLIIPIASALLLQKRLKERQALAAAPYYAQSQYPGQHSPF